MSKNQGTASRLDEQASRYIVILTSTSTAGAIHVDVIHVQGCSEQCTPEQQQQHEEEEEEAGARSLALFQDHEARTPHALFKDSLGHFSREAGTLVFEIGANRVMPSEGAGTELTFLVRNSAWLQAAAECTSPQQEATQHCLTLHVSPGHLCDSSMPDW